VSQQLTHSRLLGYHNFFPSEKPISKIVLAKKIGRKLGMQFCCHFLAHYRNNAIPPIDQLLKEWFSYQDFQYHQSIAYSYFQKQLESLKRTDPETNFILVPVESLLNMFAWITTQTEIPDEVEGGPDQMLPTLQLLLLFNDDLLHRFNNANRKFPGVDSERRPAQIIFAQSFPQHDLTNPDYAQLLNTQFFKAALLLEFMASNAIYQPLLSELLNEFQCPNKEDYYRKTAAAAVFGIKSQNNGWTVLNIPRDQYYNEHCFILDKLATYQEPIQDLKDDYRLLRTRPLRKLEEGKYLVIYDLFLIKRVYNGLVFYLSDLAKRKCYLISDFFGKIRTDFSEGQLVYNSFRYIYPEPEVVQFSGTDFKNSGLTDSEPDYYIRIGDEILLIESKDFYIKGEEKYSFDFLTIEKALKEGRLGKAILQLRKNILRILQGTLNLDSTYNRSEITIYPIILVHEALYSAPGLNYFINFWMQDALNEIKQLEQYKELDYSKIMPVTIVEIDSILLYEENFRLKHLNLLTTIKEYLHWVNFMKATRTGADIKTQMLRSMLSYSEFLRDKAKDLDIRLESGRLNGLLDKFGLGNSNA
jgi:hypothetical protein